MIIADEIEWGSYLSVAEPDCLQTRGQRFADAVYVYEAAIGAEDLVKKIEGSVSKILCPDTGRDSNMLPGFWSGGTLKKSNSNEKFGISVVNSINWDRSDVVEVAIPKNIIGNNNIRICDSETGEEMSWQFIEPDNHDIQTGKSKGPCLYTMTCWNQSQQLLP